MYKFKLLPQALVFIVCLSLFSCGGSSSQGSGVLLYGTLTEAGGDSHHASSLSMRHAVGERIERVQICVLGQCQITSDDGEWGFFVPEMSGQEVEFSFDGHGINTETSITLPSAEHEVYIEFLHTAGIVEAGVILIDGMDMHTDHSEADDHHHAEHDHDHHTEEHHHG